MSLITLFTPRILLLNTTNINLAYYHSWSGIGEYYISNQKDSEISIFKFYLIGSILVYNGSFIVLSLFETEIAQYQSFADFFLIIYYNIVETFLNLGIAYSLWKLKEA